MPLLSMDQAKLAKLRQVLDMVPVPPALGQRSNRTANARVPVLVRCTSATAAGGTETGHDQCYPAVVVDVNSLVATQADGAAVWLTLMDTGTGTVQVPTSGKVYYGLFAGGFDPFPAGASDPRLRVFSAAPPAASASSFSGAKVVLGSNANITSGVGYAALSWGSEVYDVGGYWASGAPTVFTLPATGYYHVGCTLPTAAGGYTLGVAIDSSTDTGAAFFYYSPGAGYVSLSALTAGNGSGTVNVRVQQNSGSTQTINASGSSFWIYRVG